MQLRVFEEEETALSYKVIRASFRIYCLRQRWDTRRLFVSKVKKMKSERILMNLSGHVGNSRTEGWFHFGEVPHFRLHPGMLGREQIQREPIKDGE